MKNNKLRIDLNETKKIISYNVEVKTCLTLEEMELIINNNLARDNFLERRVWIIHNILLIVCPQIFEGMVENYEKIEDYMNKHPQSTEEEAETALKLKDESISFEDILYNGLWEAIVKECPNLQKDLDLIEKTIEEKNSLNYALTDTITNFAEFLNKVNTGEIKTEELVEAISEGMSQLKKE